MQPQPQPNEDYWLTVAEVAKYLRVSMMSIYRAIDRGELKATKVGRLLRVHRTEFRRYLHGERNTE